MKSITFSLSLQKRLENRRLNLDSEIDSVFRILGIRSLLHRCNIRKQKVHGTVPILYLFILLPFLKKFMSCFWETNLFMRQINAQKDFYYRFLNHERFNWRKFIYFLALRIIALNDSAQYSEKTLIVDETVTPKTGKEIELISYHFGHKAKRSILGNQCLQLGYHNGISFFPLDMAFHASKNRPNTLMRNIDKGTNGWLRRKDALRKKTDVVVEMIKGKKYNLKQLWPIVKKQTQWIVKFQVKAVCVNVSLPKSGDVHILFVSDGKKQLHAFLSTDLELEPSEILTYYARRWAIEVFFKDSKQMLYMGKEHMGKEQSNTFYALVASYSMVLVRYPMLVFILNRHDLQGPIGPLFKKISDDNFN